MSNVINFLERMGQDSRLRYGSRGELELALADSQIGTELQAAILADGQFDLAQLLGQGSFCCVQCPTRRDEEEEEETPAREDEITSLDAPRLMALAS